jgi:hypothetical protein
MTTPDQQRTANVAGVAPAPRGWPWSAAVLFGALFSIPIGMLLSYLGLLVFYLGLFFFLIFGLVLGAAVYRIGKSRQPVPRSALIIGALVVALVPFFISLVLESRRLPGHVATKAEYPPSDQKVTSQNVEEARAEWAAQQRQIRETVSRLLAERYPPGGFWGYLRWAATDGRLEFEPPFQGPKIKYKLSQSPLGFKVRVVLCLVLLYGGVLAQVWSLRRPPEETAAQPPEEPATTSATPPT